MHPGSMNEVNILDCAVIVEDIINGELPPELNRTVKFIKRTTCYWLADGIYLKWAIFIDKTRYMVAKKHKTFVGTQQNVRKEVKRAFGFRVSRWHILAKPAMFHAKSLCIAVVETYIILRNMVLELRRDGYES